MMFYTLLVTIIHTSVCLTQSKLFTRARTHTHTHTHGNCLQHQSIHTQMVHVCLLFSFHIHFSYWSMQYMWIALVNFHTKQWRLYCWSKDDRL